MEVKHDWENHLMQPGYSRVWFEEPTAGLSRGHECIIWSKFVNASTECGVIETEFSICHSSIARVTDPNYMYQLFIKVGPTDYSYPGWMKLDAYEHLLNYL